MDQPALHQEWQEQSYQIVQKMLDVGLPYLGEKLGTRFMLDYYIKRM